MCEENGLVKVPVAISLVKGDEPLIDLDSKDAKVEVRISRVVHRFSLVEASSSIVVDNCLDNCALSVSALLNSARKQLFSITKCLTASSA